MMVRVYQFLMIFFCINDTCQSLPGGAISNWQQYPNITGMYTSQSACDAVCGQTSGISGCMGDSNGPSGTSAATSGPNAGQPFQFGVFNYNPNATVDDGSCIAIVFGCTDPTMQNYFPGADYDDGSCTPQGQTACDNLTHPIGGSNWQSNVQDHGWETTFTCLIDNANNPCSLLRKKIDDMNAQLQKPFFQNNQTHHDRVTQHIAFAQNLGNSTHDCNNLQNLSPGDDTNLVGGSMNWNKPQWESDFTSTVSDHANPCNFLQNRITAWQTKLTDVNEWSTAWIEMLEFKIEHAESLQTTHNC